MLLLLFFLVVFDSHSLTLPTLPSNPVVRTISPSSTVEIFGLVQSKIAKGEIITSLCVGEPNYPPPLEVLQATSEAALVDRNTKYTTNAGTLSLRSAISTDLNSRKNLSYRPTDVLVTNGAKQACFMGVFATVGAGDEVIIPSPYYPSYPEMVKLCGGVPVFLETTKENNYLIEPDVLYRTLTEHPKVKLLIMCNPSNPTGTLHTKSHLTAIADVLSNHKSNKNVAVLSDEIYERLLFKPNSHVAFASINDDMNRRTMTVNGFSKSYSMTGYRLGYLACASSELTKPASVVLGQTTGCASSIR